MPPGRKNNSRRSSGSGVSIDRQIPVGNLAGTAVWRARPPRANASASGHAARSSCLAPPSFSGEDGQRIVELRPSLQLHLSHRAPEWPIGAVSVAQEEGSTDEVYGLGEQRRYMVADTKVEQVRQQALTAAEMSQLRPGLAASPSRAACDTEGTQPALRHQPNSTVASRAVLAAASSGKVQPRLKLIKVLTRRHGAVARPKRAPSAHRGGQAGNR